MPLGFRATGFSSINDAGTRVGLWVSALEILAHPGAGGKADKHKVQTLLGRAKLRSKAVKRRRFKVSYNKTAYTVALPGRIYEDLYAARTRSCMATLSSAAICTFGDP